MLLFKTSDNCKKILRKRRKPWDCLVVSQNFIYEIVHEISLFHKFLVRVLIIFPVISFTI